MSAVMTTTCPTCRAAVEIDEKGRLVWHTRPDQNTLNLRTGELVAARCPMSWEPVDGAVPTRERTPG